MQVTSTCASFHYTDLPLATYRADALRLFGRASWVGDSPLASLERD
jgi:hypothetical protein